MTLSDLGSVIAVLLLIGFPVFCIFICIGAWMSGGEG